MPLSLSLRDAADNIAQQLTGDRRYLHQHPELAWQEDGTALVKGIAGAMRATAHVHYALLPVGVAMLASVTLRYLNQ